MSILSKRIKERRLARGLTLAEVGEFLGVKEATVQRYESSEIKNIKHEIIASLADLFKCDPAYLMGWTDELVQSPSNDILYKFNALDSRGKHTVRTVLEVEYDRCTKPHLEVIAAHNDDLSDEQLELMKKDLEDL